MPKSGRQDARPLASPGAQLQGQIVRVIADKGFGFLRDNASQNEYFFHHSNCYDGAWEAILVRPRDSKGNLTLKCEVTFEPTETPKGLRAEHVRVLV